MLRAKPGFFWPLRLIAVFSLVVPALFISHAAWQNYRTIDEQANERIERALDILQEHALKALQTVERSISETNEVLRGLSHDAIRARESDLYLRLKRTQQALPQIEAIWAFDRDGHPLVSSTILPVPRDLDNSDRSYFAAQKETDQGTYIGEVVRARIGALRFFVVSGRRIGEQAGRFDGVIGVTVMPDHFTEFYRKLARGRDAFAMIRADGAILARYPEVGIPSSAIAGGLTRAVQTSPEAGTFTGISPLDGIERRFGYRKVPGFPVFVQAGVDTAALLAEFCATVMWHLALGLPVALAMFVLSLYALRGAQRFQEEVARREAAEAALKQSQRLEAIGQLTGGVAHDFNNLLTVVSGNAQRIRRFVPAEGVPRRSLEAIEIAVRRGSSLTRQLLSFARRQTHEARTIDLNDRLPAIRDMLQSGLRGDIVVEVQLSDGLWPTCIDVSEFELALLNLAVNARDAMNGGGTLTIVGRNVTVDRTSGLDIEGEFVAIGLQDTGSGIPRELLDRVFEPFFTTKDVGKGTGLGLSQVYGFARQAGGTATITSEPGRGTTVTLYLPRSHEPTEPDQSLAAEVVPLRVRERGQILLVEDNADVAEVTRSQLEEFGYTVLGAASVAAARDVLRQRGDTIDLVFSDIMMPGDANGFDLARWIRDEHGRGIPVVLATGYSADAQAAAAAGFIVLRKPYQAAELRTVLMESMRKRGRASAV